MLIYFAKFQYVLIEKHNYVSLNDILFHILFPEGIQVYSSFENLVIVDIPSCGDLGGAKFFKIYNQEYFCTTKCVFQSFVSIASYYVV